MANSKQAIKRVRQNSDKYKLRHAQRSVVRTAVKAVKANIDIKDKSKFRDEIYKRMQNEVKTQEKELTKESIYENLLKTNNFIFVTNQIDE